MRHFFPFWMIAILLASVLQTQAQAPVRASSDKAHEELDQEAGEGVEAVEPEPAPKPVVKPAPVKNPVPVVKQAPPSPPAAKPVAKTAPVLATPPVVAAPPSVASNKEIAEAFLRAAGEKGFEELSKLMTPAFREETTASDLEEFRRELKAFGDYQVAGKAESGSEAILALKNSAGRKAAVFCECKSGLVDRFVAKWGVQ